jgi:hypothetical protein
VLVEVGFRPSIGLLGADKLDSEGFFIDKTGLPGTCVYLAVGYGLVLKRKGCYCNFPVHVEFLVETGSRLRRLELETLN